jgi:twitching motility protein PilU
MKQSNDIGMQTFDQALYRLYAAGEISYTEALQNADSRTDLALRVRLDGPAPTEPIPTELLQILPAEDAIAPWVTRAPTK